MKMEEFPRSFNCTKCGKNHHFTAYVIAHWDDKLVHTCDCGALHNIRRGIATPIKGKKHNKQ